jgi:hypothetical protein
MPDVLERLITGLTDRYRMELEFAGGGMAGGRDSSRGSADVTEVASGGTSL